MSTPKPAKSSEKHAYSVKYSNKTGGAYADIKAVIQSERENWSKSDKASQVGSKQGHEDSNRNKKQ